MPSRLDASERRKEIAFAVGNLIPATVLGAGLVALPVRYWPTDMVVGGATLALAGASSLVIGRPAIARRALLIGARVLLGVGILLVTVALLSLAFLAGIHGDFGRGGVTLMLLVTLLVLPYAVVYPLVELWWLAARRPVPAAAAAPETSASPDGESPA
ncbi:MAG TPA: hypothetical protein VFV94_09900 [Polyangiaceae bacterium]|nr:hypothetical protein [Polyangiaceae bacterium]